MTTSIQSLRSLVVTYTFFTDLHLAVFSSREVHDSTLESQLLESLGGQPERYYQGNMDGSPVLLFVRSNRVVEVWARPECFDPRSIVARHASKGNDMTYRYAEAQ